MIVNCAMVRSVGGGLADINGGEGGMKRDAAPFIYFFFFFFFTQCLSL